jgi:hypothetical protein
MQGLCGAEELVSYSETIYPKWRRTLLGDKCAIGIIPLIDNRVQEGTICGGVGDPRIDVQIVVLAIALICKKVDRTGKSMTRPNAFGL